MYFNEQIKKLHRIKFHDERSNILRLDMNENPEGLPPDFVEEVKRKITLALLATYPEKDDLTKLIAEYNELDRDQITVTNGSDEALALAFRCFGKAGSKVVTVTPTFEMYSVYAGMNGMTHVTVSYNDDFTIDSKKLIDEIDEDTSIVVILNPNSPIGTVYTEQEAKSIIEMSKKCGALVIIDEAYYYYCSCSFISLVNEYDNVLVLRTFSKICSIAGLRVGYAAGDKSLIECLENAESTFNVNNIGILFAGEILKRTDIIEQIRAREAEGRNWLTQQLTAANYKPLSLEGNFVLFRPKHPSEKVVQQLKKRGIWIRDYNKGVLDGYLRVTTGSPGVMKKFWECFSEVDG